MGANGYLDYCVTTCDYHPMGEEYRLVSSESAHKQDVNSAEDVLIEKGQLR